MALRLAPFSLRNSIASAERRCGTQGVAVRVNRRVDRRGAASSSSARYETGLDAASRSEITPPTVAAGTICLAKSAARSPGAVKRGVVRGRPAGDGRVDGVRVEQGFHNLGVALGAASASIPSVSNVATMRLGSSAWTSRNRRWWTRRRWVVVALVRPRWRSLLLLSVVRGCL